jgi:hypothetical protein
MGCKGTIQLIRRDDDSIVRRQVYHSFTKKEAIIETWKKLYGKKFYEILKIVEVPEQRLRKQKSEKKNKVANYGKLHRNHNTSGFKKKY